MWPLLWRTLPSSKRVCLYRFTGLPLIVVHTQASSFSISYTAFVSPPHGPLCISFNVVLACHLPLTTAHPFRLPLNYLTVYRYPPDGVSDNPSPSRSPGTEPSSNTTNHAPAHLSLVPHVPTHSLRPLPLPVCLSPSLGTSNGQRRASKDQSVSSLCIVGRTDHT